jgi:hypothetical protein
MKGYKLILVESKDPPPSSLLQAHQEAPTHLEVVSHSTLSLSQV